MYKLIRNTMMVRHTIGESHIVLHVTSIWSLINFVCNIGHTSGYTFYSFFTPVSGPSYIPLCQIHSVSVLFRLRRLYMGWRPTIYHRPGYRHWSLDLGSLGYSHWPGIVAAWKAGLYHWRGSRIPRHSLCSWWYHRFIGILFSVWDRH